MEWVVMTGKSIDEAKESALDELGVDAVDAEFEVLEEPRQGLFGRQRGEARVRARVRPTMPRPKTDRRQRRRVVPDSGATPEPELPRDQGHQPLAATGAEPPAARGGRRSGAGGGRGAGGQGAGRGREAQGAGRGANGRGAGRAEERVAGGKPGTDKVGLVKARTDDSDDEDGRSPVVGQIGGVPVQQEELTMTEQGQIAEEFVTGLLQRFGAPARTTVTDIDEETVEVRVEGSELGFLIGPKGQTLQAVQDLTRTVVQRRSVARTGRILVDMAGYRVRRREALERFTQQIADDVRSTGVQRALEPMSAADRKIVHDTANDIEGVRTVSEGEDQHRRVVVIPDPSA